MFSVHVVYMCSTRAAHVGIQLTGTISECSGTSQVLRFVAQLVQLCLMPVNSMRMQVIARSGCLKVCTWSIQGPLEIQPLISRRGTLSISPPTFVNGIHVPSQGSLDPGLLPVARWERFAGNHVTRKRMKYM